MRDILSFLLYKLGQIVSLCLPLKAAYRIADTLADLKYILCARDRRNVKKNLRIISGWDRPGGCSAPFKVSSPCFVPRNETRLSRQVFKNFGRYLVDFFRIPLIDNLYLNHFVRIKGKKNIDEAFNKKKGVIVLTAHLGNWELGGVVLSSLGYPVNAVVLVHKNKLVNDLFIEQRTRKEIKVIPMGASLRRTFKALAENELVALAGDRDFSHKGLRVEFFGRGAKVPRGPAAISLKTGAPIVPAFLVREKDDKYSLSFEAPISMEPGGNPDEDEALLTKKYIKVIEEYIYLYPEQWFMFIDFWGGESLSAGGAVRN